VFIQIIQGKCTKPEEMRAALERWRTECEPGAEGFLGGTYGTTDDDMFVGVVRFESEEMARANSDRPEQSAWWAETERLFDGPVEFHDCRDVMLWMDGGSDDAGFVQVIQGKVDEPARMRSMLEQSTNMMHEARPDIIGATIAIEDDGTFTETVAFTDEAAAREGERKEMPVEMSKFMEESTAHDVRYMDLHHPWFATHGKMGRMG
jgi:hypothetical protein